MTQGLNPTRIPSETVAADYPAPPSYLGSLCKKVSDSLVAAQHKTATASRDLLPFLGQCREVYIEDYKAEEINLPTLNGTTINGLHFPGTQKKALIYLHGNGYFYETAASKPLRWRDCLKATVDGVDQFPHLVVCNPGGTGLSEGNTHPLTVARDLLAQFEYLVDKQGIDPNHIAIAGYSMGGYLGSFGAELIQLAFPQAEINFLCERSFVDIYSRINSESRVSRYAMAGSIAMTKWAQDPIAAMESLKGRVCIVYHTLDGVIPYAQSTHSALVNFERTRTYSCIELREDDMAQEPSSQMHNRDFTDDENARIVVELKKMLKIPLTEEENRLALVSI